MAYGVNYLKKKKKKKKEKKKKDHYCTPKTEIIDVR